MASRIFRFSQRYGRSSNNHLRVVKNRRLSTGQEECAVPNVSMCRPLPGVATPRYAAVSDQKHQAEVTVLENGLRVASQKMFGQFCTVGVLIDSGSRYEVAYPSGISHFLEKLAFASTSQYSNRDEILQGVEQHGGICDCQGSRDTLIYAISAHTTGISDIVKLLSETTIRPQFTEAELEEARLTIQYELEAIDLRPDQEPLLLEMIHAAAFRDNTLGLPKFCPPETVSVIDRDMLLSYMKHHHTTDRMVLAGVGIEHHTLVELAHRYFVQTKPVWEEASFQIDRSKGKDTNIAQYTGGMVQLEKDLSNVSLGPTPIPELSHTVIGLESCSHKDSDFISFCVLNMLLGGGGSFSAGGPGKGMYTRLYLNVLNRYGWMYNATAYNHAYNDAGVFCIHASGPPDMVKNQVDIILRELAHTKSKISQGELDRAKRQLQSMLMMNLESRTVVFEDVGRQVLASGTRHPARYYFDEIGKITAEDISRVAERMLATPPAVAAIGDLRNLPSYRSIEAGLANSQAANTQRSKSRFKLF